MGTCGRCSSAVSLSPACSLVAHWPAGMNSWMNANAGAAITTIMSAATKVATNNNLALLTIGTSLHVPHRPHTTLYGPQMQSVRVRISQYQLLKARTSQNSVKKLSEKPHERANLLAIRRLIAM